MQGHRSVRWWIAAFALAGGSAATAAQVVPQAETESAPDKLPKCVDVRATARYSGYGYDHVVEIVNGCDKAADCSIATNANPQPSRLHVAAGQTQSVVTFRGSPAREFKPDVTCKLSQ
jgi:hypothetical protein